MKKITRVLFVLISFSLFVSSFFGCQGASGSKAEPVYALSNRASFEDLIFFVDDSWRFEHNENGYDYYYFDNGFVMLMTAEEISIPEITIEVVENMKKGMQKSNECSFNNERETAVDGKKAYNINGIIAIDGVDYEFENICFIDDEQFLHMISFCFYSKDEKYETLSSDFIEAVSTDTLYSHSGNDDGVQNNDNQSQIVNDDSTGDPSSQPVVKSEQKPSVTEETVSQKNAAKKAKEYLNLMAFSRKGLIEQLEYDGFSNEEAAYGADKTGADWNVQAAKKAKEYLDFMSFSRKGLIEQLEFDGFTREQAEHGVNSTGL